MKGLGTRVSIELKGAQSTLRAEEIENTAMQDID